MHHSSWFWHVAEHYWYGWWPYFPLTLVIAVFCGFAFARVVSWEYGREPDKLLGEQSLTYWRWPATILAAFSGFIFWPPFLVLIVLVSVRSYYSSFEDDD